MPIDRNACQSKSHRWSQYDAGVRQCQDCGQIDAYRAMPIEELRPCPFCGGKAVLTNVRHSGHQFKIGCYNELCWRPGTDYYGSAADAISAWNTRAHPTPTAADTPGYWTGYREGYNHGHPVASDTGEADTGLVERLMGLFNGDHKRGCEGRNYSCDCGYDPDVLRGLSDAAAALAKAEQREAAAREQIAALERENSRLLNVIAGKPGGDAFLASLSSAQETIAKMDSFLTRIKQLTSPGLNAEFHNAIANLAYIADYARAALTLAGETNDGQ